MTGDPGRVAEDDDVLVDPLRVPVVEHPLVDGVEVRRLGVDERVGVGVAQLVGEDLVEGGEILGDHRRIAVVLECPDLGGGVGHGRVLHHRRTPAPMIRHTTSPLALVAAHARSDVTAMVPPGRSRSSRGPVTEYEAASSRALRKSASCCWRSSPAQLALVVVSGPMEMLSPSTV